MKILIVDDHPVLRHGVRQTLARRKDFVVAGECGTGAEALRLATDLAPDVVVLDIHLPDIGGIEAIQRVLEAAPAVKIVVFSGDDDPALVTAALHAGACGYVLKQVFLDELIRAIDSVADGRLFVSPEASAGILQDYRRPSAGEGGPEKPALTEREKHLLRLVAAGRRNKEIAEELSLSPNSIETYRARLMKKVGCGGTAELVRYAIREGIAEA
jgi:DNA-binding NarL/FixJ family response regulator